jgi:release factor glutamine methyltransferase
VTPDDWLRKAAALLAQAQIADPHREARVLWRATPDENGEAYLAKVTRRASRVPLSQVLGYRDFYKHRFIVTEDVLDPRPDTETLIEVALLEPFTRALDLGTGSGCILLSLLDERPQATGVGTDASQAALTVAAQNRAALELVSRATLVPSDWFSAVEGQFDLIVSNPPYIAADEMDDLQPEVRLHEPRMALTDEADGLAAYRKITEGASAHITPGGRLMFEIGPTQAVAVSSMMRDAGFERLRVVPDLDGRDRVVMGYWPHEGT